MLGGYQDIYRFENGYGASVVNHSGSYGIELGVIQFFDNDEWHLTYETTVSSDVIGHLNYEALVDLLIRIQAL